MQQYLIVDLNMPVPNGRFIWLEKVEYATPFSSSGDANAAKSFVVDATGVLGINGAWYIVKDSMLSTSDIETLAERAEKS